MEYSLDELLDFFTAHKNFLSHEHLARLRTILDIEEETDFLHDEIQQQMILVRKIRQNIDPDTTDTKTLKDLQAASSSLFSLLTRHQKDIINQQRLQKIEQATVDAIKTLPTETQEAFFIDLERRLSTIE